MEQKKPEINYERLVSYINELKQTITNINISRKISVLAEELELEKAKQNQKFDVHAIQSSRVRDILIYINNEYDGTQSSVRKISKKLESPERKYQEITSHINILAYRKSEGLTQENKRESEKLLKIALYLKEVRHQRHFAMPAEMDKPESVRFREILKYIDDIYDGTEESTQNICKMIIERGDMDEVLKHYKTRKSNEEER